LIDVEVPSSAPQTQTSGEIPTQFPTQNFKWLVTFSNLKIGLELAYSFWEANKKSEGWGG